MFVWLLAKLLVDPDEFALELRVQFNGSMIAVFCVHNFAYIALVLVVGSFTVLTAIEP